MSACRSFVEQALFNETQKENMSFREIRRLLAKEKIDLNAWYDSGEKRATLFDFFTSNKSMTDSILRLLISAREKYERE